MRFSKADIPLIRWNLLLFISSVLISGAVLYSSINYSQNTEQELQKSENTYLTARNHLASAREDQKNMTEYADSYGMLIQRKIIGADQRLDWIEGLDRLHSQNLVTDFRYNISPQTRYSAQPQINSGSFDIFYSEMQLQFDLLHEQQLIDFFIALNEQINGYYLLDKCTVRNIRDEDSAAASLVNLKAECSGGWITLTNRNVQP